MHTRHAYVADGMFKRTGHLWRRQKHGTHSFKSIRARGESPGKFDEAYCLAWEVELDGGLPVAGGGGAGVGELRELGGGFELLVLIGSGSRRGAHRFPCREGVGV